MRRRRLRYRTLERVEVQTRAFTEKRLHDEQQAESEAEQSLAESTIVLYNKNLPESVQLAKYYADQRGITRE